MTTEREQLKLDTQLLHDKVRMMTQRAEASDKDKELVFFEFVVNESRHAYK